jgi:hypothetical protein
VTDDERIQQIRDRLFHVTAQGRWKAVTGEVKDWLVAQCGASSEDGLVYTVVTDGIRASELTGDARIDAEFIAHAPRDMAFLLSLYLETVEVRDRLRIEAANANAEARARHQEMYEWRTLCQAMEGAMETDRLIRDKLQDEVDELRAELQRGFEQGDD